MIEFLSGVHAVDLVIAVIALEGLGIWLYWRKTGRGVPPAQLLPNLLAGTLLLLALRLALSGSSWPAYIACLGLAGVANVADIRQRWR